jgi:hypothetical protein
MHRREVKLFISAVEGEVHEIVRAHISANIWMH